MTEFVYLHGFASGPGSSKAQVFKKEFGERSLPLKVPDLQGGDFQRMTLSSQVEIAEGCMNALRGSRFALIGSSMGGFLASLIAQRRQDVVGLYLMAPGFNFLGRWKERLRAEFKGENQIPDLIQVFHYRYNKYIHLKTDIFRDAERWEKLAFSKRIPVRIVHGIHDDTVDISESRAFVKEHPWCQLEELNSDHQLLDKVDWIVEDCLHFFRQEKILEA